MRVSMDKNDNIDKSHKNYSMITRLFYKNIAYKNRRLEMSETLEHPENAKASDILAHIKDIP